MSDTFDTPIVPVEELERECSVEVRRGDGNAIVALRRQLDARHAARAAIPARAALENRENLLASEERAFNRLTGEIQTLGEMIAAHEREMARRAESQRRAYGRSRITVNGEADLYRPDGEHSFFRDVIAATRGGDFRAAERLARHNEAATEYRDLTRTDTTGGNFVPPAYLVNQYVTLARSSRVTADLTTTMALPAGTDSINIPTVSTGAAVAIQTADNAAVQETDLVDANLAAPVRTIAGQQDVAVQLLEQSPVAFDRVIFGDLIADYASKLDVQVLSGSGASGQVTGLRNVSGIVAVTYTDATPTVAELYPKIADAISQISTNRFLAPTGIVMHPRRWAWILAALDSQSRPLVVPSAGTNAMGIADEVGGEGAVGRLLGLPVYLDANLPTNLGAGTNEDQILVGRFEDAYLWESPIRTRVLPDVGSGTLTTRLQVYGYVAFQGARYPKALATVSGAGLVAPTF